VGEGAGSAMLTVTRTGGTDGAISATYMINNGTATGGACPGADFNNTGGTVNFAAGSSTSQTITIPICDDTTVENSEDFTVTLTGTNVGANATATVTIADNDVAPPAQLTFTVTRTDDRDNPTCVVGDCSLREAVKAANAAPSNDTINFAAGVTTITLANEIVINNAGTMTISGPGANVLTINGGAGTNRIFTTSLATVTITGVTLTDGNGTGATSSSNGGAIFAQAGTLVLDGVHINLNSATTGGGVYFAGGTNHQILNSTFSVNSAVNCGGFFNDNSSILTVTNSTISGNPVTNKGGGFCSNSNTTLRSVTITTNSATNGGGGIYQLAGTLDLGNTIVAGNTGGSPQDILLEGGTVTTAGYNLIGNNSSVAATFPLGNPNANNDIVGTTGALVNPGLAPLGNYGGTTPTHALLFSSPAIDKGNRFGLTTDQRGLLRPVNLDDTAYPNAADGSDIGAFESQLAPTAATVSLSGQVLTANGGGIMNIRLSLTDSLGNVRTATTDASGNYQFDDVQAGETYILTAEGKNYTFSQPLQVLNINEETNQVNFIGSVKKRSKIFFQ
jgi:CSLREA domain-containing protein